MLFPVGRKGCTTRGWMANGISETAGHSLLLCLLQPSLPLQKQFAQSDCFRKNILCLTTPAQLALRPALTFSPMTVFSQGNNQHYSASTKQKSGLRKAGTLWFPCQISMFSAALEEGASIVISPYNVAGGNTRQKYAREVPCNTG